MEQHSIQRTRRTPARQSQVSQDFIDQEEEYDDIWPTRMPSSARRYYSSSDVSNDTGNVRSDIQPQTYSEYPNTRPGRKSSIPARSTATQTNVTTTQTRRSLTQSNIPTAQTSRRTPNTDVPAVQTRRTATSSVPAVQNSRRTATTEVPAVQNSRRTTTSKVPALPDSVRRTTTSNMPVTQTARRRTRDTESEIITRDGIMPVPVADNQRKVRFHWLFYVGLAMLAMTLMWGAISAFSNWWQVTHDDWTYGRPRTYQVDQAVGHNDSDIHKSHFIALNLNRHIEVIEFPGGDPTKAKIYIGPVLMGQGQDLAPATLSFKDVNGDGKLDMIVNVQDSRFVFINDKGVFRPLHPGENVHL